MTIFLAHLSLSYKYHNSLLECLYRNLASLLRRLERHEGLLQVVLVWSHAPVEILFQNRNIYALGAVNRRVKGYVNFLVKFAVQPEKI